ncbi:PAS domain S-box protein, partial [Pseudoalteromonas sp. S4488]|uniref:PAS domain S-box protein n=1 Tax=Pseudoalteromonas sp. S4488 TaxID=579558 RepID=UPI001BB24252
IPHINPDYYTKAHRHYRVARIKAQETTIFESCLKQKDGQLFPKEVSVCQIAHQGKSYLLAIVRDISARINKEQD